MFNINICIKSYILENFIKIIMYLVQAITLLIHERFLLTNLEVEYVIFQVTSVLFHGTMPYIQFIDIFE